MRRLPQRRDCKRPLPRSSVPDVKQENSARQRWIDGQAAQDCGAEPGGRSINAEGAATSYQPQLPLHRRMGWTSSFRRRVSLSAIREGRRRPPSAPAKRRILQMEAQRIAFLLSRSGCSVTVLIYAAAVAGITVIVPGCRSGSCASTSATSAWYRQGAYFFPAWKSKPAAAKPSPSKRSASCSPWALLAPFARPPRWRGFFKLPHRPPATARQRPGSPSTSPAPDDCDACPRRPPAR